MISIRLPLLVALLFGWTSGCAIAEPNPSYALEYALTLERDGIVDVTLTVTQDNGALRRLKLLTSGEGVRDLSAAAKRTAAGERVWTVPPAGGAIRWKSALPTSADDDSVRALVTDTWAVFRVEDVLPRIASVSVRGADAATKMQINLPDDWSIATAYAGSGGSFVVEDQARRFDRPDGWIVAGDIGVRRDLIGSTQVAVAAPREQNARRLDVMAFLSWHLPLVQSQFSNFPDRLLVAMADDPFFRGGLSAPNSLFLHADRPLISGNGTSTLLHELFHVGLSRSAGPESDWIVEGLAEFYSQQWLFEAGTVTEKRHAATLRQLKDWGNDASSLRTDRSSGAVTALAVSIFASLDNEIRRETDDARLSDVVKVLARDAGPLTLTALRDAATTVLGKPAVSLQSSRLPGYDS
ncbi:MAG: hypothetical protein AAGJ86_00800 [Pseudomonadota bacterium]